MRARCALLLLIPLAHVLGQTAFAAEAARYLDAPARLPTPGLKPARGSVPQSLSLEDIQQIALENNPTMRLASAQVEKERGMWTQVGLYPNPILGYLRTDPSAANQPRRNGGFVRQVFVTGGKLRIARQREEFGLRNTMQQREAQRWRILNDIRIRYYDTLGAQQRVAVAERMLRLAQRGYEAAEESYKAKQASRRDVIQSELQLNNVRLALRNAKDQQRAMWQHLTDMMGTPDMPLVLLEGQLEGPLPQIDLEHEWQRVLALSPLLRSLEAQVGIARKNYELARVQPIPNVTGQVVVERDSTNRYTSVQTLLALPVPIFNRNQGGVYNMYHEYRRAQNEVQRSQLALRDLLTDSYRRYTNARNHVETLQTDLLPGAQENLDLTTEGYEKGQFNLTELLTARHLYFKTQLDYVDALTEVRKAAVEVTGLQLTGGLNPATIGTAIQGTEDGATQRRAVQTLLQQQQQQTLRGFTPGTTGGP